MRKIVIIVAMAALLSGCAGNIKRQMLAEEWRVASNAVKSTMEEQSYLTFSSCAFLGAGIHLSIAGERELAMRVLRRAHGKEDTFMMQECMVLSHYYLGEIYSAEGMYREAAAEYSIVIEKDIVFTDTAREKRGEASIEYRNYEEAYSDFSILAKKNPGTYHYWNLFCMSAFYAGKDDAEEICGKAVELFRQDVGAEPERGSEIEF